jgi:GT2 family glycosyltransferase
MQLSLVICSRDREEQLRRSLAKLNLSAMSRLGVDLVLVDSASSDGTGAAMAEFGRTAGVPVQVFRAERPGASRARNIGARAARGDVLIFTDDDCYLDPNYFDAIQQRFDPETFRYGGGDTRLFDEADAVSGVTHLLFEEMMTIPAMALLPSGVIQGANMFFVREVFEQLGGFNELLGAGTPFPCEDVELCTRASLSGHRGVLIPDAKVLHHHGRRAGSRELAATEHGYDRGRGAYYARLLSLGQKGVWDLWSKGRQFENPGQPMSADRLNILRNEMRGAADYLDMVLGRPPG